MLIITRKVGESFYIGDNVLVTVLETSGEKIKVAIDAPREISVLRKELVDAQQINQEALGSTGDVVQALRKNLPPKPGKK